MRKNSILLIIALIILSVGCARNLVNPAPTNPSRPKVTASPQDNLPSPIPSEKEEESPYPAPSASSSAVKKTGNLEKGKSYLENGNYKEAMQHLNQALKDDPESAEAYIYRGRAFLDLRDYKKAKKDLQKAIALEPESAQAHLCMGILLQITYDEGASEEFTKVIEIDPGNAEAYYRRGVARCDTGKTELAKKDLEKAYTLDKNGETGELAVEKLQELKNSMKRSK